LATDSSTPGPRWAAVVVNFEAGPLLAGCVASLLADTSAGPMELVVVDNRSRDGSVAELVAAHPEVQVVRAPGNVGYARAANLGIAATKAPIVAVMNPDTVVQPGTAGALVSRLEREPRLAVCGPRLRNPDGSDYPSARTLPSIPVAIGHGLLGLWWPTNRFTSRYRQLDADPAAPRLVDWVSGAAIWLRRRALDDVGGWDER
jgi:GT2 family glycosyltransferase